MKKFIYLQLFAEGAAGASGDGSGNSGAETAESGFASPNGREGLSHVVYGKPSGEIANPKGKTADTPETREAQFEEMIKGDYKDVFAKRTQAIIDERFKKTKGFEEKLKSLNPILNALSDKYGVKADDIDGLIKALDEDESFYQRAAMEAGVTVKQYKEMKALERQNQELLAQFNQQKEQEAIDNILAQWTNQAKEFSEKYGIDFDLQTEIQNPDFKKLLNSGISIEGAYKAVHFDDMVGGAMAYTAEKVKKDLVKSVNGRAERPQEGAVASHSATTFKSDVNALTKADREEIERRAMRGEVITF